MAQSTAEVLDISKFLAANKEPRYPISRSGGICYIRGLSTDPTKWRRNVEGPVVEVPLVPFVTNGRRIESVILLMASIAGEISEHFPAKNIHWIIGTPIEDLSSIGQDSFRIWLGVAVEE